MHRDGSRPTGHLTTTFNWRADGALDAAGSTTWYTRGWGQELTRDASGTLTYLLADRLGSIRAEASSTGTLTTSLNFDPYGQPQGTAPADFGFTGEPQAEAGAGLVHLRARWYAPGSGAFVSRDAYQGEAASPRSQQPYGYALQAPTTWTDPSGFCSGAAGDDDYTCVGESGSAEFDWSQVAVLFRPGVVLDDEYCSTPQVVSPEDFRPIDSEKARRFVLSLPAAYLPPPIDECDALLGAGLLPSAAAIDLNREDIWRNYSSEFLRDAVRLIRPQASCERYHSRSSGTRTRTFTFVPSAAMRAMPIGGVLSANTTIFLVHEAEGGKTETDSPSASGISSRGSNERNWFLRQVGAAAASKLGQKVVEFTTEGGLDYRGKFVAAHPEIDVAGKEIHHLYPQVLLKIAPHLYKAEEIHSLGNLVAIDKVMHPLVTRSWQAWFAVNSTFTKAMVDSQVATIFGKYGSHMSP